jgi:hypothetical protein
VLARYQAWLFFPLLMLEAVHLHAASVKAVARGAVRFRRLEALLLLAHIAGYLTAVLIVLTPLRRRSSCWSTRACSACTWDAPSHPTTRACRCSPDETSWTTSGARC